MLGHLHGGALRHRLLLRRGELVAHATRRDEGEDVDQREDKGGGEDGHRVADQRHVLELQLLVARRRRRHHHAVAADDGRALGRRRPAGDGVAVRLVLHVLDVLAREGGAEGGGVAARRHVAAALRARDGGVVRLVRCGERDAREARTRHRRLAARGGVARARGAHDRRRVRHLHLPGGARHRRRGALRARAAQRVGAAAGTRARDRRRVVPRQSGSARVPAAKVHGAAARNVAGHARGAAAGDGRARLVRDRRAVHGGAAVRLAARRQAAGGRAQRGVGDGRFAREAGGTREGAAECVAAAGVAAAGGGAGDGGGGGACLVAVGRAGVACTRLRVAARGVGAAGKQALRAGRVRAGGEAGAAGVAGARGGVAARRLGAAGGGASDEVAVRLRDRGGGARVGVALAGVAALGVGAGRARAEDGVEVRLRRQPCGARVARLAEGAGRRAGGAAVVALVVEGGAERESDDGKQRHADGEGGCEDAGEAPAVVRAEEVAEHGEGGEDEGADAEGHDGLSDLPVLVAAVQLDEVELVLPLATVRVLADADAVVLVAHVHLEVRPISDGLLRPDQRASVGEHRSHSHDDQQRQTARHNMAKRAHCFLQVRFEVSNEVQIL
eukprot:Rhum_TRINITY_DN15181_c1_g10::Rhum_TRINITY_DN15181_c1_g10_i1::g.143221::m.143221